MMLSFLLFLFFDICITMKLSVCLGFRPNEATLNAIAKAYRPFRANNNIATIDVHANVNDNDTLVASCIKCHCGFETDTWGRAPTLEEACRMACERGQESLEKRISYYMPLRLDNCVVVDDDLS